ncbi:hypothetical protein PV08_09986 [Exophiala spinifera]|uniref:Transcription factor domain-containing protein n=1 Tax=Exophiala spinifera TaxID=91928 RepID=A0A0D2B1B0_9EURO|nr:uncharacterized protein PV08_09986 [Exophiala spinifera]KIW12708.1 hypothetical protein PV08_09986 [Exophiala spinifera]
MGPNDRNIDAATQGRYSSSRRPNGEKEYYFVNKSRNSSHLSQSASIEQARIQSHVQRGRRRNRPGNSVSFRASVLDQQVEAVAKCAQGDHTPNPRSAQADTEPLNNPIHVATPKEHHVSLLFVDYQPKHSKEEREFEDSRRKSHAAREAHRRRRTQSTITSPTNQASLCKVDPFGTASVKVNNTVAGLLHYYVYFYHPTIWPNEMAILRHGLYTFPGAVNSIVRMAVEDRLAMCCLLSASASRLQFVDRLPCAQVTGMENYYLHNALRLLRSRIDTSDFQASEQLRKILICIAFLVSAEAYRDGVSAAKTHLEAAVGLLSGKGGLMCVEDENLRGQLAMGDLYIACVNFEPCLFDCDYDPGPASSLGLREEELKPLGDGGTATSLLEGNTCFLPLSLRVLIEQILDSYSVKNRLRPSSMSAPRALQVTHWVTMRNMAIRHRLLALTTDDPKVNAVRVAIIMWTLLTMNITGRTKTVKIMAPMLRSILGKVPQSGWIGNSLVHLWILVVGFSCTIERGDDSAWFVKQCYHVGNFQRVPDPSGDGRRNLAEKLEDFQRGFFFDVQVQRPRTQKLAEQLIQLQLAR